MTGIGHNSAASDALKMIVERIERLENEKKGLADDVKDLYLEAKGNGYEAKILREVLRRRKMDRDEREEHDSLLATYEHALGMAPDTD